MRPPSGTVFAPLYATAGWATLHAVLSQIVETLNREVDDDGVGARGVAEKLRLPEKVMLAHYPAGARYVRHSDVSPAVAHRRVTVILYLNEDWRASDGGHLRVYFNDDRHIDVAPKAGTLVLFKSDTVPHEVLPTTARRLAVVGWYHRHHKPPPDVDDAALSPLARALRDHYRAKGQQIKLAAP